MEKQPLVACSRMYNVTPAIQVAWTEVFDWVAIESGIELNIIDHAAPNPLGELWERPDLGCVLMCGWPYAIADPKPKLIIAPVPSAECYEGKPIYFTDIVVRADRDFECLEDTFGGKIVWTADHSNSGYNSLRHHLLQFRDEHGSSLYSESIGPVISPFAALNSIIEGDADVGPVDSWFHDLLKKHRPEFAQKVKVIAVTEPSPIPPIIASPDVDDTICAKLTAAFAKAHDHPVLSDAFETLLMTKFEVVSEADYSITNEKAMEAKVAGYEKPG